MTTTSTSEERPLVGRGPETREIAAAIDALKSGRGGVVFISGEPGIGKSTLARFASRHAIDAGVPVFWGFAWEAGGAPAYWPWTQLLRSLVAELEPGGDLVAGIGQLLPEAGDAEQPTLGPEQARFQLLEAVRGLLDRVSGSQPLVCILEDLHAADSDSLQLLHYVARHATSMPVLIVGTFRDIEARASDHTDALWRSARDATHLRLDRLDESDLRAMLDDISETDIRELMDTTAGNPLFVTELVGLLARRQQSGADKLQLPASIQQVIRQQQSLLPEATGWLLSAASILGREFSSNALAAITDRAADSVESDLQPALDTQFVSSPEAGTFRFSHALHRDSLYKDLDPIERSALHLRYGEHLRERAADGEDDRWSEIARHLNVAGPGHRGDAIAAWRKAAARAIERLAFDDAVTSLTQALAAFGTGPRFDPLDRFDLLIESASAHMLKGEHEVGQRHCRDAFSIASGIQNPALMARAALTWGNAIIVAKVDYDLIAALREALDSLPDDDVATRAGVQARLAGAMQPAKNPGEPMDMAREAIALARATLDDDVLFEVLRSAISALMDFAPVAERIPLNAEFAELANKRGDVPALFRSKLRLMMDSSEAGDRTGMLTAIADCERLAEQIGLPHYQWRAASARAMQATIEGRFADAQAALDAADGYAGQINDVEAMITLSLQRFALLVDWESDQSLSLADIQERLDAAYRAGMHEAEFFIAPFIAAHTVGDREEGARQLLANQAIIERTFAGGDRYSVGRTGELAILAGDRALAERAFDAIRSYAGDCATLGLMATSWCGPVAHSLGIIALGLGRHDAACAFLQDALTIATNMHAEPTVARIHGTLAEVATATGDADAARTHEQHAASIRKRLALRRIRVAPVGDEPSTPPRPDAGGPRIAMQLDGDVWRVEFEGDSTQLKTSKGLVWLAQLIATPDKELHVLDLAQTASVEGDAGPALDPQARSEYEERVRDLREELDEARELGDEGRADRLEGELDFILKQLSRAFGLGGRARPSGSAAERARVNVRRRLKDAIERIGEAMPAAGRYLDNTIKTGTYCRYSPM